MFKFFRKRYTTQRLAELLRDMLSDFEVFATTDSTTIAIKVDGYLVADIVLLRDGREAFITFSGDLQPNMAGELALLVNDLLPAYVDTQFMYTAIPIVDERVVN